MNKKKILYIISAGRSGSTLLDIILGNDKNAVSLGEVNRFFKRNGIPPKRDKNDKVFQFWGNVKDKIDGVINFDYSLATKIFHRNEYHSAILKELIKKEDSQYVDVLKEMYKIISEETSQNILVESSKYPNRALNISKHLSKELYDIKYIYIKKDPVTVVESFRRRHIEQPSKNFFSANFYYLTVNLLCRYVVFKLRKRRHKVATITYEDLLRYRDKEINRLGRCLEMDLKEVELKVSNNENLQTGYLFDGNRIRLMKEIRMNDYRTNSVKKLRYIFTRLFNYTVYR